MAGCLHHIAICTGNFEETVWFFQTLFDMEISRTAGDAPNRMLWFRQGIQVNETPTVPETGTRYHHLGFQVENRQAVRQKAAQMGCTEVPGKPHWFISPEGIVIELKE